jgi:hypothetical protein
MSPDPKTTFTFAELRAFRWLALILGAVLAGISILSDEPAGQFLAAGLVTVTMIAAVAGLYLLRRRCGR